MAQGDSVLITVALLLMGLEGSVPAESSVASIINDCWKGRDHSGMSACVEMRAKEAQASLSQAEQAASDAIASSKDEPDFPKYRSDTEAGLSRAPGAFAKYRKSECAYEAALASKGNGADDVRLACIALLSEERAQHIQVTQPVP